MSALVVTSTRVGVNMGDHAQDVTVAHEVDPAEPIGQVAARLLSERRWVDMERGMVDAPNPENYLVVRIAQPKPEATSEVSS